jgi:hypothetical protein
MKIASLAVLSLFAVAACESRPEADETGARGPGMEAADTIVTQEQRVETDTAFVTRDTNVEVDTVSAGGDESVSRDTLQQ